MIEVFKYIVEPRFNMQRDWGTPLYNECLGNVTSLSGDEVIKCV